MPQFLGHLALLKDLVVGYFILEDGESFIVRILLQSHVIKLLIHFIIEAIDLSH
jgi:hypothetical protein